MDEADILGDRIAIMSDGVVKCCGSSLFLKQRYGVGYTFTVSLEIGAQPDVVQAVVMKHVKTASLMAIAAGEITYRLPFEETSNFANMFEELDAQKAVLGVNAYGVSVTTLEEVFFKIGEQHFEKNIEAKKSNEIGGEMKKLLTKEKVVDNVEMVTVGTTTQEDEKTNDKVETNNQETETETEKEKEKEKEKKCRIRN